MISFEEVLRNGRGWYIKVKVSIATVHPPGREKSDSTVLTVTIGRIERSREGMFCYFEPGRDDVNPVFVDRSLANLKKRIKAHRKG